MWFLSLDGLEVVKAATRRPDGERPPYTPTILPRLPERKPYADCDRRWIVIAGRAFHTSWAMMEP